MIPSQDTLKHDTETHRIDLTPAQRYDPRKGRSVGIGESLMTYEGRPIGSSRQPLYDAARYLLDHDLASPADRIVTYRGNTPSLAGIVGSAARTAVSEEDRRGLRLVTYRPVSGALGQPRQVPGEYHRTGMEMQRRTAASAVIAV